VPLPQAPPDPRLPHRAPAAPPHAPVDAPLASAGADCSRHTSPGLARHEGVGRRARLGRRTSLHGRKFHNPVVSVGVSCVALATARHPQRGFLGLPNPVHDLGANGPSLGTGLWTTVGSLWINLAQARLVHGDPELSQGCPHAPSPGVDTSRRGGTRVIHTIHSTYYYYCFYLQGLSTKKKQGCACARTHASRSGSKDARGRLELRESTLYGDDQRLVLPRGGACAPAAPRVWKGLS
jgi:hypothetical protein